MKLATFLGTDQKPVVGVVSQHKVVELKKAAEKAGEDSAPFADMLSLIAAGDCGLDQARRLSERYANAPGLAHELASLTLLAPVPVPTQIRDFSAFPGHLRNAPVGMRKLAARMNNEMAEDPEVTSDADIPAVYRDQPVYYKANRLSVVGTDTDVHWPQYSRFMDFELEFGIFIGKAGRDIPANQAATHIFGYSIFNDFTARDAQLIEMRSLFGPAKGKDFDTGNVIGPWIVTRDEIPNPYALKMSAKVNGKIFASDTSSGMMHSFEDMIAYVSRSETIFPGEFFGSGTMGGGCGLEFDRYLTPGDIVELEVERIGTLSNRIVKIKTPEI